MKQKAIIIDLDGTLCDNPHRATTDMKNWKDYEPLYKYIPNDKPNEWCVEIMEGIYTGGYIEVIFLTGRPEKVRGLTTKWLQQRLKLYEHDYKLIMMPPDWPENKRVTEYKQIEIRKLKKEYDILFVIDDNKRTCKMYEKEGIKALWCGGNNE